MSRDDKVFIDQLYDCLCQTVDCPIGDKLPAKSLLTLEQLGHEFAHTSLTEQARKKLLREYKMDTQFKLLPCRSPRISKSNSRLYMGSKNPRGTSSVLLCGTSFDHCFMAGIICARFFHVLSTHLPVSLL